MYPVIYQEAQVEMESVDDRELDYSLTQATTYHYWKDEEKQSVWKMLCVYYFIDTFQIVVYGPIFLVYAPSYYIG